MPEQRTAVVAATSSAVVLAVGLAVVRRRRRATTTAAAPSQIAVGQVVHQTPVQPQLQATDEELLPEPSTPDWVTAPATDLATEEWHALSAAPLKEMLLQETLPVSPSTLYATLSSPCRLTEMKALMDARDVVLSRVVNSEKTQYRTITFLSVGSITTRMHEVQRVGRLDDGTIVLWSCVSTADAPYASYFAATMKFTLRPAPGGGGGGAASRTDLEVSFEVAFHKTTMLKGRIEAALADEARCACDATMPYVKRVLAEGADDGGVVVEGSAALSTGAPPPAPLVVAAPSPRLLEARWWWLSAMSGWLTALLLLLVLLFAPNALARPVGPTAAIDGAAAACAGLNAAVYTDDPAFVACAAALEQSLDDLRGQLTGVQSMQKQLLMRSGVPVGSPTSASKHGGVSRGIARERHAPSGMPR